MLNRLFGKLTIMKRERRPTAAETLAQPLTEQEQRRQTEIQEMRERLRRINDELSVLQRGHT